MCKSVLLNVVICFYLIASVLNTPSEVREAIEDNFNEISVKNPYWFTTLFFEGVEREASLKMLQYTFVDYNVKRSSPVVVYASTVTGKPSKDNYMYMAVGQNATINIPNQKGGQPIIMYFNVVPLEVESLPMVGKTWSFLSKTYQFTTNTFTIENTGSDLAQYVTSEGLFIYHSVPENSKVNFTISLEDDFTYEPIRYTLYYSTLKNIAYPTPYNANVVKDGPYRKVSTTRLVTDAKEGPFAVALVISTTYQAKIKISVNVIRN
ncbi:hypothetical protein ABK040_010711 [Willaertia magna]